MTALSDVQADIRSLLCDASTTWSNGELEACIDRAVSDLSRVIPRELIYDATLSFTVTNEDWTSGVLGVAVTLGNSMIKVASEVVKTTNGVTTFVRDTDYTMNYAGGTITPKTLAQGGTMLTLTGYHISYSKMKIGCNLSSISSTLMQISRVEYPAGQTPQEYVSFQRWGDYIFLTSGLESQSSLSESKHVFIYYTTDHTPPDTNRGTYPEFLDSTVLIGAMSYALYIKSYKALLAVATDLGAATTALGATAPTSPTLPTVTSSPTITTELADVDTALDTISTLVTSSTGDLTTLKAYLVKAEAYLTTGDDFIDTVNIGGEISQVYKLYADAEANIAAVLGRDSDTYVNIVSGRIGEAKGRIDIVNAILEKFKLESDNYASTGKVINDKYGTDVNLFLTKLGAAEKYIASATQNLGLAERYRAEAIDKKQEFWAVLMDKAQMKFPLSYSTEKQGKQ
jgi:hypothetical protein